MLTMKPGHRKPAKTLVRAVRSCVALAHAPYSKIRVAAGLYCARNRIYTGVNIENSSSSLTMCAERVAVFKALSEGIRDFKLMLVYSPEIDFIVPCGACLQVLSELAPGIVIATMDRHDNFRFHALGTLLPQPFRR